MKRRKRATQWYSNAELAEIITGAIQVVGILVALLLMRYLLKDI